MASLVCDAHTGVIHTRPVADQPHGQGSESDTFARSLIVARDPAGAQRTSKPLPVPRPFYPTPTVSGRKARPSLAGRDGVRVRSDPSAAHHSWSCRAAGAELAPSLARRRPSFSRPCGGLGRVRTLALPVATPTAMPRLTRRPRARASAGWTRWRCPGPASCRTAPGCRASSSAPSRRRAR